MVLHCQPRLAAYIVYIRHRLWANRAASSPPAPARISRITLFFVICVLGDQQQAQILLALRQIPANFAKFLLYHSSKRRVRLRSKQFLRVLLLLLQVGIAAVFFDQGVSSL